MRAVAGAICRMGANAVIMGASTQEAYGARMFDNGYVLILLVIFVALWTAYTAQKKGRSPLRWGGVALIPVVDPALALLTGQLLSYNAAVTKQDISPTTSTIKQQVTTMI